MRPPNVVLIFCDDLGYGDLGCYGSRTNQTPRLDKMASEGMRFLDFYASAAVCSPSRASLLTGCYAQRVGLGSGDGHGVLFPTDPIGLSPSEPTLASGLKSAGYATACIGKWHVGDQREFMPDRHGFGFYFGLPYSNDMHPHHPSNDEYGFPPLPLLRIGAIDGEVAPADQPTVVIEEIEPDQSRLELTYTDLACRFIREHAREPFFLYFAHMYVHRPLFAPDEFLPEPRPDTFNGYTDTSIDDYAAEVSCLDWSTGRILDTLSELGIDDSTLVVFTSDNGSNLLNGGSNAPLRGRKGQFFEGGFRMPCIMRWPGMIRPGFECHHVTSTMDLLPTFLDLATDQTGDMAPTGPSEMPEYDGISLASLLRGASDRVEGREEFAYYLGSRLKAVRDERYKLHCESGELFDLQSDPGETQDVAATYPEVVRRLERRADAFREDLGDGDLIGHGVREPGRVSHPRPVVDWVSGP